MNKACYSINKPDKPIFIEIENSYLKQNESSVNQYLS